MEKRTNDLVLKIQDFRAIKNAEIILDGISVVAGVNGSGKSTISKVLYHFLKTVIHYDEAIQKHFEEDKSMYHDALSNIIKVLKNASQNTNYKTPSYLSHTLPELLESLFSVDVKDGKQLDYLKIFAIQIEQILDTIDFDKEPSQLKYLKVFLSSTFNIEVEDIFNAFQMLTDILVKKEKEIQEIKQERPLFILNSVIYKIFYETVQVHLENNGLDIIDYQNETLFNYPEINRVAYYDSPMLLGFYTETKGFEHWNDMNKELSAQKDHIESFTNFSNNISKVIGGNNVYDDHYMQPFRFERKDGKRFNLLDCATGLKSFSMIQMLIQNGFIGSRTLLIIDEPEAHLHPQWVVEYARLLVLLNKHTGCKFLLASHHPDMISALKYISQAEGTEDNFNLYFAEESDEEYKYNFENQNGSLERVFESLNIGLDKIDEYGKVEDSGRDVEDE